MTRIELLREDLDILRRKTEAARYASPGAFVSPRGGKLHADEQRLMTDLAAGRLHFHSAHESAQHGLRALDEAERAVAVLSGDVAELTVEEIGRLGAQIAEGMDLAAAALDHGRALYIVALEAAVGAAGLISLRTPAKERGRKQKPKISERNWRLAGAVDRLRATDPAKSLTAAIHEAIKGDPFLTQAFKGKGRSAVEAAYHAGAGAN